MTGGRVGARARAPPPPPRAHGGEEEEEMTAAAAEEEVAPGVKTAWRWTAKSSSAPWRGVRAPSSERV